jgi:hypothetical protein
MPIKYDAPCGTSHWAPRRPVTGRGSAGAYLAHNRWEMRRGGFFCLLT